uniref:Enoyl reductase (ER) domain-containing protein n=1 Tax=Rhodosorus marinus TaxID=101924 RepID=A0A7S0BKG9_9RHOD|mmetsp:Transcript_20925/g.30409  ORF Transcript_20925/g.30409 Transcript_20925/m.30409 type:complete len:372 (+) Transcript_20925:105-1220(+)
MGTIDRDVPDFMDAVVNFAPKDFRFSREMETPKKPEHGIVVKVTGCGICASDVKCYEGAGRYWGDSVNEKWVQAPIIPGHEFVGEVAEISEKDSDRLGLCIGDQVTSEQIVACYKCLYCKKGKRWLCQEHDIYGFRKAVPGAFAQYMVFPENSRSYKIKKSVEPKHAAYTEPLACAIHGVSRGRVEMGDTVVVSGSGAIGLGMITALKAEKRASRIIALDCSDERLEIARKCGADILLNPLKENVVDSVKNICGGYGCDVYLEAAGNPASVIQGIQMTMKGGRFVEFGVFKDKTELDWSLIGDTKELEILGGHLGGDDGYQKAISWLESGLIPVEQIVTDEISLRDFRQGVDVADKGSHGEANSIKVVLTP